MKKTYLNEDNLPPKLPVSFSTKIRNNINLIKDYNQNNPDALSEWYDYIENLKSYISNRKIAWDYANRYTHFRNGAIHLVELGYNVKFIVSTDKTRGINYVYIFQMDLKPQEFGLKVPPHIEENKKIYKFNIMKTNKKIVRLTESKLKNIIAESVKRILRENNSWDIDPNWDDDKSNVFTSLINMVEDEKKNGALTLFINELSPEAIPYIIDAIEMTYGTIM